MGILIPPAPELVRDSSLYRALVEKSRAADDGLAEKVEQFLEHASPMLDLTLAGPFRQYTLHNRDHAKKIVHLASFLISEPTLKNLSALECAVIIFSAYLHDLGMCLTSIERERVLRQDDFSESLRNWPELWHDLQEARERLNVASDPEKLSIEAYIFQLQEAALCAYLRPIHASPEKYVSLLDQMESLTGRKDLFGVRGVSFRDVLVHICVSHNLEAGVLSEVIDPYEDRFPREMPIGGERLNTQFCAAVLRLADILDFDRERTPRVLFESLGIGRLPTPGGDLSLAEWQKHMAVHSLEISASEMVVSADCTHPAIEQSIREFCKILEREFRHTAAVLKRNAGAISERYNLEVPLIVRPRVKSIGYVFKEMALRLNEKAIINLLMGERLYAHTGVALRELVQNALDACSVRSYLGEPSYKPSIQVGSAIDDAGRVWIEVRDDGMGMDEYILNEHFFRVGTSYYSSPEFQRLLRKAIEGGFAPISRFGIGILSVFMIADVLEVTTRHACSPRGDHISRTARIEARGGLAFLSENAEGEVGTCVRIRLKKGYENERSIYRMAQYVRGVVIRPKWPVEVALGEERLSLRREETFALREDGRRELLSRGVEAYCIDLSRWSNRFSGSLAIAFGREPDGQLSHRLGGRRLVFAERGDAFTHHVDPHKLLDGYHGNRVSVNGFLMNLKKANRTLGTSRKGIRIAFDFDIRGDAAVLFDVARDRIIGEGALLVRRELREAIQRALEELRVFERLHPETQQLVTGGGAGALEEEDLIHDETLLQAALSLIPDKGWHPQIHKKIAEGLRINKRLAWKCIATLVKTGRVAKPSNRLDVNLVKDLHTGGAP